jgi:NitT/TauT family transport system ATP-binding protein
MRQPVVVNLALCVQPGERIAIVGPSGCGKSTLLRLIGGIVRPDGGSIQLKGASVQAADAGVVLVPQQPAVADTLTVRQHFMLPYKLLGARLGAAAEQVSMIKSFGLQLSIDTMAGHLSQGEKQLVALGMILQLRPTVVLLDEPFSALDMLSREQAMTRVVQWLINTSSSAILVTHSITEAVSFASRVLVAARPMTDFQEFEVRSRPNKRLVDLAADDWDLIREIGEAIDATFHP